MTSAFSRLLFGTAGVPLTSPAASTLAALEHVRKLGLGCLEVEFVMGVKMGADTAGLIRSRAESLGIALSVHAPYAINLNSAEEGKRLSSQKRLVASARLAQLMGARNVVFHSGYYGQASEERTFETIKQGLREVLSILRSEKNQVALRPETMGKRSQFGSLDEILLLCREVEGLRPCLDFSHIHAREGQANSYRDFSRILRKLERKLGREALATVHIHIAGIHYGDKGEIRHLDLQDSDFRYDDWVRALRDSGAAGMVICESPHLEADALMLKSLYDSYRMKS